jgi:hypothetical protein
MRNGLILLLVTLAAAAMPIAADSLLVRHAGSSGRERSQENR